MERREFVRKSAISASLMAAGPLPIRVLGATERQPGPLPRPAIGIQIGAVSFSDEGVNQVLDNVQQLAGVNTLFIPVFAFNRGLAGRTYAGHEFPDHGKQFADPDFTGGYYATMHEKYYADSMLKPEHLRARELGDYDVLAEVLPEAGKRGMKVIAFFADNYGLDKPFADQLCEVDISGKLVGEVNFVNPQYRASLFAILEDCVRSYGVDGVLWRSERLGPMSNVLQFNHYGTPSATSFDPYTIARAEDKGINVDRVRKGYSELIRFATDSMQGNKPVDGSYVTFWRILFNYPEILAWHQLFVEGLREVYQRVYGFLKGIRPELQVGWALSFKGLNNPFYKSRQDLQELGKYSDFLKIVMYNNIGGTRFHRVIDRVENTVYGDMDRQQILDFFCAIMGYEKTGNEHLWDGLPPSLVKVETEKAIKGAAGTDTLILPGIDVGLPPGEGTTFAYSRGHVKNSVLAAFQGGAEGILIARKYSEMKLDHLAGAGDALRELKIL